MENKLLTLQEAADILRVNVMTLYRWKDRGIIEFIQLPGNDIRVWQSEIDRVIEESTKQRNIRGQQ